MWTNGEACDRRGFRHDSEKPRYYSKLVTPEKMRYEERLTNSV